MFKNNRGLLALLPLALLAVGCGGGGGKKLHPAPSDPGSKAAGTGKVTLGLVNDSPAEGLKTVTLKLAGMDIREKGKAWIALPLTTPEVELINAQGPAAKPLVDAAPVPAGVYTEFRIRFAPDHNHLKLRAGDTVRDLKMPEALVDADVHLEVEAGATAHVTYFFNTAYAVREQPAGSGAYTLRAPKDGHLRDRARTGAITGKVTWAGDGTPMAGVALSAQRIIKGSLDILGKKTESSRPKAFRTVVSREDGTFELDLLEEGYDYQVVAQAGGGPHPHKVHKLAGLHMPGVAGLKLALEPAHAHPGRIAVVRFPGETKEEPATSRRKVELVSMMKDATGHPLGPVLVAERSLDKGELCVFEGVEPGKYVVRFSLHSGSKGPITLKGMNRPGGFIYRSHSSSSLFEVTVDPGATAEVPKAKGTGGATMGTGTAETEDTDAED